MEWEKVKVKEEIGLFILMLDLIFGESEEEKEFYILKLIYENSKKLIAEEGIELYIPERILERLKQIELYIPERIHKKSTEAEAKAIIQYWTQYWMQKISEYYKSFNTDGIATKIILTYVPETKLIVMWSIFCTLRFMLSEIPTVHPFPVKTCNAIKKELYNIEYLSTQDKREILEFIEAKIDKAINRKVVFAKEFRKDMGFRRNNSLHRYTFPETILSEAKNRANFAFACLFYFFDYELPDFINSSELKERIKQIEKSQGYEFDHFDKASYVELDIGTSIDEKDHKESRENKKWIIVSGFLYEQLNIEKDKEEILKILKRYRTNIPVVYHYIFETYPHGGIPFLCLPETSGGGFIYDEQGDIRVERFNFFYDLPNYLDKMVHQLNIQKKAMVDILRIMNKLASEK